MIHAESVNYWKTSKSSPDTWMEKTKRQIEKLGGQVLMEGFGRESVTNRAAFVLAFAIGEDRFKVVWPVLPSKSGNEKAAKVQAVTMLYHGQGEVHLLCRTRSASCFFLILDAARRTHCYGDVHT